MLKDVISETGQQPGIFAKEYDWDFLLVFGDAYEKAPNNGAYFLFMASLIGVEPTAFRLGGEPSIQLRYRDMIVIY